MAKGAPVTFEEVKTIIEMWCKDKSVQAITDATGRSEGAIYSVVKRVRNMGVELPKRTHTHLTESDIAELKEIVSKSRES